MGVGERWIGLIKAFYLKNVQTIGGHCFEAEVGIRQGCPLFPLIFAVVADILLRRLSRLFPQDFVKAFVDNTAMVVKKVEPTDYL